MCIPGGAELRRAIRRDVGQDAHGRRRRVLHARARDPQGQGQPRQAQPETEQAASPPDEVHALVN